MLKIGGIIMQHRPFLSQSILPYMSKRMESLPLYRAIAFTLLILLFEKVVYSQ